eukprot:7672393-Alexandrium_andersonii.AAC.1
MPLHWARECRRNSRPGGALIALEHAETSPALARAMAPTMAPLTSAAPTGQPLAGPVAPRH